MAKKKIKKDDSLVVAWWLATPLPDYTTLIEQQSMVYYSPVK